MLIKTPDYWQEEKYQPLVEAETAYGHKVKIPKNLQDIWNKTASLKGKYPPNVELAKAAGYFAKPKRHRERRDIIRVYYEEYQD